MAEGTRFQVLAPVVRGRKGEYVDLFAELQSKGYARARVDGVVHPLTEPPKLKKQEKHTIEVVVDRLAVKAERQAAADRLGRDRARAGRRHRPARLRRPARGRPEHRERRFSEHLACPNDHPLAIEDLEPRVVLLQRAVRRLPGVHRPRHQEGGRPGADRPRPGAHPARGRDPAVGRPGTTLEYFLRLLEALGEAEHFDLDTPWRALPSRAQKTILHGAEDQVHVRYRNKYGRERSYYTGFEGVVQWIERRHSDTESRLVAREVRGLHARRAVRGLRRRPAQARGARGHHRRPEHRRGLRPVGRRVRRAARRHRARPTGRR